MSADTIHADIFMTRMQAAAILKLHNAWRRGEGNHTARPGEIDHAIDIAVAELERAANCPSCVTGGSACGQAITFDRAGAPICGNCWSIQETKTRRKEAPDA